jgi:hypothetical protein
MTEHYARPAPVLVNDLAREINRHHTNVHRDLKKRGFALIDVRAPSGQMMKALSRPEADRYLAARRAEAAPAIDVDEALAIVKKLAIDLQAAIDLLDEIIAAERSLIEGGGRR